MPLPINVLRAMRYVSDQRNLWHASQAFSLDTVAHMATRNRVDLSAYRPGTGPGRRAVTLCLTFDVERDWGSFTPVRDLRSVEPFAMGIAPLLKSIGAAATFLVEGGIIRERPETWVQLARNGHEIGLHGYHHESWGVDWFNDLTNSPLVDAARAGELLTLATDAFADARLPPPRAFRAPNLVLDPALWPLLLRHGIRVDSSAPGMKGERPLARVLHTAPTGESLLSVPASTPIVPRVIRNGVLPQFRYALFSLQNALRMNRAELIAYAEDICRYQIAHGQLPHLTFLAHPWEFVDPPASAPPAAGQLGARNLDAVAAMVETLSDIFKLEYRTLSGLAAVHDRSPQVEPAADRRLINGTPPINSVGQSTGDHPNA